MSPSHTLVTRLLVALACLSLPAIGETQSATMTFSLAGNGGNCSNCAWIAAEGEITSETPTDFERFLSKEAITYSATVAFNSPGGDLAAGLRLGEIIRERRLDTTVFTTQSVPNERYKVDAPGICASACAYAFLGGVNRHIGKGSRIGVHQFVTSNGTGSERDTQRSIAILAAYMAQMGVSRDLVLPAGFVPPDDVYWLNQSELENLNVVTDRTGVMESNWTIGESQGALTLETVQPRSDGAQMMYLLQCGMDKSQYLLIWAMELAHLRLDELAPVADSIDGFSLQTKSGAIAMSFAAKGKSSTSLVMVGSFIPRDFLVALASSSEPVELNLNMPHFMQSYVGWEHPFPRSNLLNLLPIIDRNC